MNFSRLKNLTRIGLLGCALVALAATGCQTTIGGQTLPSAYYLTDDVQYYPAGPEFLIPNEERALQEYRLQQQGIQDGLGQPQPVP